MAKKGPGFVPCTNCGGSGATTTTEIYTDRDGWTLRSADGSRGAHMEHTVAITEDGPIVLTARA